MPQYHYMAPPSEAVFRIPSQSPISFYLSLIVMTSSMFESVLSVAIVLGLTQVISPVIPPATTNMQTILHWFLSTINLQPNDTCTRYEDPQ